MGHDSLIMFDIFCKAQARLFAATTGDDRFFLDVLQGDILKGLSMVKVIPTRALNDLEFNY